MQTEYERELAKCELEVSSLIRKIRKQKRISQEVLYQGLCTKKTYQRFEQGEGIGDELLAECILSRLHVQYRLLEVVLSDEDFWLKECRYKIGQQLAKGNLRQAEKLLAAYEKKAKDTIANRQYIQWKRAEILQEKDKEMAGKLALQALELTLPLEEVEKRFKSKVILSEPEVALYLLYRKCDSKLSLKECEGLVKRLNQMYVKECVGLLCYYELAFIYAKELLKAGRYEECRENCTRRIGELDNGNRSEYLPELQFIGAVAGMKKASEGDKKELRQEIKTAYYTAMAFAKKDMAMAMKNYCQEEFGWHITG